jgi:uncharacterized DUF497 family protein
MRITLSRHARRRMRERAVAMADIRHVLMNRGPSHPSRRKREERGRALNGERLEVVYTEVSAGVFHIVSVKKPDRRE